MDRIKAVALDAGVADRVLFRGHVTRDILVDAYRMADLYVMPSTGEGFGIAFLEAMASGTPALGLAVAGACDALADGELGMVVSEKDFATSLSDALARLPISPGVISSAVRDRFGRATFLRCVRGAFERLLEVA
jgi:phosphatidylinositol alpha-1,6-mannosyltransferase